MSQVDNTDGPYPSDWTAYHRFAVQQEDLTRLPKAHRDKWGDLLAVPLINLNTSRDAASDAIKELLRYPDGRATEFVGAIERQVTASFDYLRTLRSIIEQTGVAALVVMVHSQDGHLLRAVTPPTTPTQEKGILVAFSAIEDQTITLTQSELNTLIKAVAQRESKSDAEVVRREAGRRADNGVNARGGKLDEDIWDSIDILALILVLMRREGLKPAVKDPALQQWLVEYFAANPSAQKMFGGAAGNETFMLCALGCPVLLHVPYHHDAQAAIAPERASRLVFGPGGPIKPFPGIKSGNADDARRSSFVFQLTPERDEQGNVTGPTFRVGGRDERPLRADRIIPRLPNPRTDTPAGWNTLRVTWKEAALSSGRQLASGVQWDTDAQHWCVEVQRSALAGFGDHDWPYLPLFQHPPTVVSKTQTLIIELASADDMQHIAGDVQVALLGGIQGLGKMYYTPALTELLREALVEQLRTLSTQGVDLHLELSGVDSGAVLDVLKDLLHRAGLKNVSLNREELVQITSEFGSPYFTSPRTSIPDTPIGIYFRAAELLKRLGVDTVYVHDLELDILVRRYEEGEELARGTAALEGHRQAMLLAKAAVPAALIYRAKVTQHWDLVLSTESLAALLVFTADYAALVASAVPVANRNAARDAVRDTVLTNNYYYPGVGGVSMAVAPGISVNLPKEASLSGAGDMDFAARSSALGESAKLLGGARAGVPRTESAEADLVGLIDRVLAHRIEHDVGMDDIIKEEKIEREEKADTWMQGSHRE